MNQWCYISKLKHDVNCSLDKKNQTTNMMLDTEEWYEGAI